MLMVNLLFEVRRHLALADILVDRVVGEAQIILIGQAGQAVRGRLDQILFGQTQFTAQRNDLLRGIHTQRRERPGAVAVDGAVAHPVLAEVGGVDDDAAGHRLSHGVQCGHADAGGQVHLRLAAGRQAHPLHLVQNAAGGSVNINGAVGNIQHLHQTVAVINVRLHAVGHQHAVNMLLAVGRHRQRRHGGAVLTAGDADDRRFAAAVCHLLVHPFQQSGQLQLCVKFHRGASLFSFVGDIVSQ